MKKTMFVMLFPFVLAACAEPRQPTVERQAIKDACVNGDYDSCAEIGHIVHRENLLAEAEAS